MNIVSAEYVRVVKLAQDLESIDAVQKEIANKKALRQKRAADKKRVDMTHPDQIRFPRDHVSAYIKKVKEDHNSKVSTKRSNIRFWTITFALVLAIALSSLIVFLDISFFVENAKEAFLEHWWTLALSHDEKTEQDFCYYVAIAFWMVIAGIASIYLDGEFDTIAWKIVKVCSWIAAAVFLIIGIVQSGNIFLGLLSVLLFAVVGIAHWLIWGFIAALPYISILLIPVIIEGGYALGGKIGDRLSSDTARLDSEQIMRTPEYQKALREDQRAAAIKLVLYEEKYTSALAAVEIHNHTVSVDVMAYDLELKKYEEILRALKASVAENSCLDASDKNKETVQRVLYFLSTGRASSIKEALQQADTARFRNEVLKGMTAISVQLAQISKQNTQLSRQMVQVRTDFNKQIEAARREVKQFAVQQRKSDQEIRREIVASREEATREAKRIQNAIEKASYIADVNAQSMQYYLQRINSHLS